MLAPTPYLFVYGTLRRDSGHRAHRLLRLLRAAWVDHGRLPGRLYDLGPYPAMVDSPADGAEQVRGEVYQIDPCRLEVLDRYEGIGGQAKPPYEYRRLVRTATLDEGRTLPVWVYLYALPLPPNARWIESGDLYRGRGG